MKKCDFMEVNHANLRYLIGEISGVGCPTVPGLVLNFEVEEDVVSLSLICATWLEHFRGLC